MQLLVRHLVRDFELNQHNSYKLREKLLLVSPCIIRLPIERSIGLAIGRSQSVVAVTSQIGWWCLTMSFCQITG